MPSKAPSPKKAPKKAIKATSVPTGTQVAKESAAIVPAPVPTYLEQSKFYREARGDRRKRILEIDATFREHTLGELSDVDYYNLTTLQHTIEDLDGAIEKMGGPEMAEPQMLADQKKAKESITSIMQKWREGKVAKNTSLGNLKEAVLRLRGDGGSMFTVEIKKDEGVVLPLRAGPVIDVPAVPVEDEGA